MPIVPWNQLVDEAGDAAEEYGVLPAADYDLKIIKSEAKQARTGKLMYAITCEVTEGPYKGRKVWSNIVLTRDNPTALGFFFRNMAAIGIDKSYFMQNPSDSQVADALLGREFRGQVAIKQWQGQDRNELKSYFPKKSSAQESATTPPPPPMPTQPSNPQPTTAQPQTPTAPAAEPQAAATAPPAPQPAQSEPAPQPPQQPETPSVPDTAEGQNGEQPAPVAPSAASVPSPPPTQDGQEQPAESDASNVPAPPPPAPF